MPTIRIGVVRHGEKDGDKLTPKGERQIKKVVQILFDSGFFPDIITHSPTNRTKQCAQIAKDRFGKEVRIQEHDELSPEKPILATFPNEEAFMEEVELIARNGGTVSDALFWGKYPKIGQEKLSIFLLRLANSLPFGYAPMAICFSHTCYSTLAVDSLLIPYCAPEGSCIIYSISEAKIAIEKFITI